MHISFSPQRRDDKLYISKQGDTITINGDAFDFSTIPDGGEVPYVDGVDILEPPIPCKWIVGPVQRVDGKLHLTLILPHGPNASEHVRFPQPLIDPPDGELQIPREPVIEDKETPNVDA